MSQYAVIYNPKSVLFKHEVWFKGKGYGQDAQGYKVEMDVCRKVEGFVSAERAANFISYRESVDRFVGGR